MIEFLLKSTLSLTILYMLYFFLLRNSKAFQFNRLFLMFTVCFSIAIPFLHVKTSIQLPVEQTIRETSSSISGFQFQGISEAAGNDGILNIYTFLLFLYLLIASVLLVRFVFNLHKIIKTIKGAEKVLSTGPQIVLTRQRTLPYSFFNYIIVNKSDYETGNIESGLIIHEQTHCREYHSFDILLIEILKIALWFNPVLWILKKEIQLVHEYAADSKVLQQQNLKVYQNSLLNLVLRNNSPYLVSNFNYSLTKKRLIMMTKYNSNKKSTIRKIIVAPLVILLAVSLTFSQTKKSTDSFLNYENEWWYSILEKHNIELLAFNNFQDVFEMGTSNAINDGVVTLTDALFIIREKDTYRIIKSPLAYHDLDKNEIKGDEGTMELFSSKSDELNPTEKHSFKRFKLQVDQGISNMQFNNVTGEVKTSK